MKLSELSTDRAADVLSEVCVYVANITTDEELMLTLKNCAVESGATTAAEKMAWFGQKFSSLIPVVLKKHKTDVFAIIAVLHGVKPEEIAKQNILKTMAQIREVVRDKDLVDFFKSCALPEETE